MDVLINITFPVFAIVAVGYLSGRWQVLGSESGVALNRFVYYFALPSALFLFTARASVTEILNWPFIAAFLLGTALTLLVALVVGRLFFGYDGGSLTLHGLAAVFANVTFIGLPLFLTAFGEQHVMPVIVSTIAYVIILVGGTISALEIFRARERSFDRILVEVAGTLVRNPLLVASFLGFAFSYLSLPVPKPIANFLDLMAATAGPAALFALGLSLVGRSVLGHIGEVCWLVLLKLLVQPFLTFLLVYYVFSMDPFWAKSAIILAALPSATLVFVLAQQYDIYVQRASAIIVLSTVLSVLSLSVLLTLLEVG